MCRRCGERDRRGSASERRRRRGRLLEIYGNGVVCPCAWCGVLLSAMSGRLHVRGTPDGRAGTYLPIVKLEQDRLMRGGPYALWNLVPACGPCNKGREFMDDVVPAGCNLGARPRYDLIGT